MNNTLHRARKIRWLIPLFISSIVVSLMTEIGGSWLQLVFGEEAHELLRIFGVLLLIALVCGLLWLVLGPEKTIDETSREMRPGMYEGLVVIIGPGRKDTTPDELSHSPAIEYHLEQRGKDLVCWLIASNRSVHIAEQVRERYESECKAIHVHAIDAFDVQDAYNTTEEIYAEGWTMHQLRPEQIISDYTGGTKPMSAGMLLACRDRWPLQYMFGKPGEIETAPVLVKFAS